MQKIIKFLSGERFADRNKTSVAEGRSQKSAKSKRFIDRRSDVAERDKGFANNTAIEKVLVFISNHGLEPIRVNDLARMTALSRRGFQKAFNKYVGESPGRKLRRLRLQHAQKLLLGSTHKLTEIAQQSGFRNKNTFWVAFKQCFGISPMRFQREMAARLLGDKLCIGSDFIFTKENNSSRRQSANIFGSRQRGIKSLMAMKRRETERNKQKGAKQKTT